jgi:hypothetical protein
VINVEVKVTGEGVQVIRLRAKNRNDSTTQTIQLEQNKGQFDVAPGICYLITRYVVGPAEAPYKITLNPPESYSVKVRGQRGDWNGKHPLEAAVWGVGYGLHNNTILVEKSS